MNKNNSLDWKEFGRTEDYESFDTLGNKGLTATKKGETVLLRNKKTGEILTAKLVIEGHRTRGAGGMSEDTADYKAFVNLNFDGIVAAVRLTKDCPFEGILIKDLE